MIRNYFVYHMCMHIKFYEYPILLFCFVVIVTTFYFLRLTQQHEMDVVFNCIRGCVRSIFRENFDSAFEHLGKIDGQVLPIILFYKGPNGKYVNITFISMGLLRVSI